MIRGHLLAVLLFSLSTAISCSSALPPFSSKYSHLCGKKVFLNVAPSTEYLGVRSTLECAESCSEEEDCSGFNYFQANRSCQLLSYGFNKTTGTQCGSAVPNKGADFYHRTIYDCLNNGTYVNGRNNGTYVNGRCECYGGWVGRRCQKLARDCSELYAVYGVRKCSVSNQPFNIYSCLIHPKATEAPIEVYCWLSVQLNAGQIVIQTNFAASCQTSFTRPWADYKAGFGDCSLSFWLGNDRIHSLTAAGDYTLYVTVSNRLWPPSYYTYFYGNFTVGPESSDYEVHVDPTRSVSSTVFPSWDSLTPSLEPQSSINGQRFSTFDRDLDRSDAVNCASKYGGGWWFNNCTAANLNGVQTNPQFSSRVTDVTWKFNLGLTYINTTLMGLYRPP